MKNLKFMKYFKRILPLIIVICVLATFVVNYKLNESNTYVASEVIHYNDPQTELGFTPTGDKFDVNEIKSSAVVSKVVNRLELTGEYSVDSLISRITITPIPDEDKLAQKEAKLKEGEAYIYEPSTYIVSFTATNSEGPIFARTILDEVGAEKLVSRGDMLLKPVGALKPIRVQGAFINEDEREAVVNFIKEHSNENYDEDVVNQIESNTSKLAKSDKNADNDGGEGGGENELDEKFYAALEIATDMGKISSSYLQRKLNLGFQRAARIIDQMEDMGYIGEANGSKPREVLITKQEFLELRMKNED